MGNSMRSKASKKKNKRARRRARKNRKALLRLIVGGLVLGCETRAAHGGADRRPWLRWTPSSTPSCSTMGAASPFSATSLTRAA